MIDEEVKGAPQWHNGRCTGCTGTEHTGCCYEQHLSLNGAPTPLGSGGAADSAASWRKNGGVLDRHGRIVDANHEKAPSKLARRT